MALPEEIDLIIGSCRGLRRQMVVNMLEMTGDDPPDDVLDKALFAIMGAAPQSVKIWMTHATVGSRRFSPSWVTAILHPSSYPRPRITAKLMT